MSAAVLNLINQLNPYEEDQVYNYVKNLIDKRNDVTLEDAKNDFYAIREEAKRNGTMGMSLDEINEEIRLAREERKKKMQGSIA